MALFVPIWAIALWGYFVGTPGELLLPSKVFALKLRRD